MRPTGRLHIGHYFGALQNWVRLQKRLHLEARGRIRKRPGTACRAPTGSRPAYDCFYFMADWHALTSDYADTSAIAQNTIEIMTDFLAAGLDPAKSVIFLQSLVPEHAELHLLLSMVTPLRWLERVPTYKEALENVKDKDLHNYGFLGVSGVADGGHCDLQRGRGATGCAGGGGSGVTCGVEPRDRQRFHVSTLDLKSTEPSLRRKTRMP